MLPTLALALCLTAAPDDGFVPIFDGKSLAGWTPKITGYALGDNHADTFRVEEGVIKVRYDKYADFGGKFGHLFYKEKISHYVVRVEYRFVGEQVKSGPGWAFRNSGVMFHCQAPETMRKDQEFPVSIEAQMLGGNGKDKRTTGNVCSPGTHIVIGGKLVKQHCNNSKSKTFHGDQWVTLEVEVRGNGPVTHRVNGEVVLEYEKPQLDDSDPDAKTMLAAGADPMLKDGYISLQAESHPCEFRKVELKKLDPAK